MILVWLFRGRIDCSMKLATRGSLSHANGLCFGLSDLPFLRSTPFACILLEVVKANIDLDKLFE